MEIVERLNEWTGEMSLDPNFSVKEGELVYISSINRLHCDMEQVETLLKKLHPNPPGVSFSGTNSSKSKEMILKLGVADLPIWEEMLKVPYQNLDQEWKSAVDSAKMEAKPFLKTIEEAMTAMEEISERTGIPLEGPYCWTYNPKSHGKWTERMEAIWGDVYPYRDAAYNVTTREENLGGWASSSDVC